MLSLWIIIALAALIALSEGPSLFKAKKRQELGALGILLGMTLLLAVGKALGMPTPLELLERWLRPAGEALFGHL